MARLIKLVILLLCPVITLAQSVAITGKVLRADTKAPLSHASVFLGNSSFGTSTADDGTFTINGIRPGRYNFIVTTVGFEDNSQVILINTDPVNFTIELSPRNIQLKEVNISTLSKADRKLALERFKAEFIGEDDNAKDCKLINPEVLNFSFHQNKNVLEAFSDEFFIVENRALGYRIKFLMKKFNSDFLTGSVIYQGQRMFEQLPGKESQIKKWRKKRDEAYYGSAMHFYRSLYKDSLASAGFKIYRLTRTINPNRPSEGIIQQNLTKAKGTDDNAFLKWTNIKLSPKYSVQTLGKEQLAIKDVLRKTDQQGLFAVTFADYLYVIYTKKWETNYFRDLYREPYMLNYETTIVSLLNKDRIMFFDRNGTTVGDSPLYEGTWSRARLSTMLPVDYTPANNQP
ncbi:carboxypeptidase-like regulatory domain-containing protein [Mucilaginibacter sp.]|uniref:carboxypeptidase-like regulatory domain-containing protein n=1 Tax=Mucilaginibacter sp. TaxID=1882438 RepID=UPI002610F7B3|nr:carboxypeptidase-like regulatory domain-containing protein [Mucilaginibacter sp.]MDB4924583.1 hypothetical protein [Mucilaginibacter sp.]